MIEADLLLLAKELCQGRREVDWRAAVSRAYYAAFHTSLGMLMQCGVRLGKSSSAHDKVAMCLQNANNAALEMVGSKLASLCSARNEADYNLKSRQFQSKSMAEAQIANADEIIAAVAGKHTDEQVRTAIRKYAQDILGLSVAD